MQRPKSLDGSKNQVAQDIWDKSGVQLRPRKQLLVQVIRRFPT